jgi:hypothetical protein
MQNTHVEIPGPSKVAHTGSLEALIPIIKFYKIFIIPLARVMPNLPG